MSYKPPEQNPKCDCFAHGRNPFFCPYGHLTECHYPFDCEEAQCNHYQDEEEPLEIDSTTEASFRSDNHQ